MNKIITSLSIIDESHLMIIAASDSLMNSIEDVKIVSGNANIEFLLDTPQLLNEFMDFSRVLQNDHNGQRPRLKLVITCYNDSHSFNLIIMSWPGNYIEIPDISFYLDNPNRLFLTQTLTIQSCSIDYELTSL